MSNNTRILPIIMLITSKNSQGYKEQVILFIAFSFGQVVTINDWLAKMKLYMSDIEVSYKDTIVGNSGEFRYSGCTITHSTVG